MGSLVFISIFAAIDAIEPFLRGCGGARVRELRQGIPDGLESLLGGGTRERRRSELRALSGRNGERPNG
jgi:hypothetical protein